MELNEITKTVIGCAYTVGNTLGYGFLEKVYENALAIELRSKGLLVAQQHGVIVRYQGQVVGEFQADLLVEECVLIELKAAKALDEAHVAQCINYLKATGLKLCLLINFGAKQVDVRRIVREL
jgi:GxxExxY protein